METRKIEISLDTARRLYEQGGEYRNIALTAFKEHELIGDRLPKTWEEFCKQNKIKKNECYIGRFSETIETDGEGTRAFDYDRNMLPNKQAVKQHLALMQLHQLRDCYRNGWKPNWSDNCYKYGVKWNIFPRKKELIVTWRNYDPLFLSFPTYELAEEFLTNFRELIEEAGDLI